MTTINGTLIAHRVHEETRQRIEALKVQGIVPGLTVILVGSHPASLSYVRAKDLRAAELGMYSKKIELPASTTQQELLHCIAELNTNPRIHGILVQLPLPKSIHESAIIAAIDPKKDVDGFHPENIAKLVVGDLTGLVPCTPLGCQRLLMESGVETAGAHVVVVGRSLIVGKPMALLLLGRGAGGDATVTVVHSKSRHLPALTREADILIVAMGQPKSIQASGVREGAVVIDVGINRVTDPSAKKGYRLVGDVDFDQVAPKCAAITPVPGGVGPMTIAMLMANTVKACEYRMP